MNAQAGHNSTGSDRTPRRLAEGRTRTSGSLLPGSSPGKPLISVVTVVRNGRDSIERTIQSVFKQSYPNLEYIVIDGGSTDGTVDIIRQYADRISYWTSEPDRGIYDAMNKALDHVHGEGHLFLNAGDHFVGDAIPEMPGLPCYIRVYKKNILGLVRPYRRKSYHLGLPYCHQGVLFETRGIRYDLAYRVAADYNYYLDHGYRDLSFCRSSGHVYHDVGHSKRHATIRDAEIAEIIGKRFPKLWVILFELSVLMKNGVRSLLRLTGIARTR
jgi:putative colanic acid biosynthesis glycosyltransferase